MYLSQLNEPEKEIVAECLKAVLNNDFFGSEFETRIGITKEKLKEILERFPDIDDANDNSDETLAINNCLNEICYGIKFSQNGWRKRFSHSREETLATYRKWTKLRGWESAGVR